MDRQEGADGTAGSHPPALERQTTELQMLTTSEGGKSYDRSYSVESANGDVATLNGDVATLNGGVAIDGENDTSAEVTPATPNMASTTSSTA